MSTTNRNKEIFIGLTAIVSAIVCLCASISFFHDTYQSGKATDLAKAMIAVFYMSYFVLVSSDRG